MTPYLRGYIDGFRHGYQGNPYHISYADTFHHRRWMAGYRRGWTAGNRTRMRNW